MLNEVLFEYYTIFIMKVLNVYQYVYSLVEILP